MSKPETIDTVEKVENALEQAFAITDDIDAYNRLRHVLRTVVCAGSKLSAQDQEKVCLSPIWLKVDSRFKSNAFRFWHYFK